MASIRCDTGVMFWCEYPRDVVRIEGADAATYLQSQVSQDLRSLEVGVSTWSFLLQPTGKVEVLMRVWRVADDAFVLDTDAGFGEAMTARLNRFKIRVKADITPLDWHCIAVRGASYDGLSSWGEGADLLGANVAAPAGITHGSADDLLAARVHAQWPAMGAEIASGHTLPAETGAATVAAAVSFTKGCYPGQELVERMDSRGASAPRSLMQVEVAEGTQPGSDLVVDGVVVGTVTSVSGTSALAMVKRSAQ